MARRFAPERPPGRRLAAFGFMAVSVLTPLAALAPAAATPEISVIYPPWWSASQAFTAAARDAEIVRAGRLPFILIVRSSGPEGAKRLKAGGAVLLLDLGAGSCGTGGRTT